jgi:hypothetical protein
MTCSKQRNLLIPWLDGELKAEQAAELKAWFDSCAEVRHCFVCRKLIDEHTSFHRAIQSTPQSEFPAFLHHRILNEIKSREPAYRKQAIRTRWQLVPAGLAILMSLFVGSLVGVRTFATETADRNALNTFGDNGLVTTLYTPGGTE